MAITLGPGGLQSTRPPRASDFLPSRPSSRLPSGETSSGGGQTDSSGESFGGGQTGGAGGGSADGSGARKSEERDRAARAAATNAALKAEIAARAAAAAAAAAAATESKRLTDSLRAREELTRAAIERGRGFTRIEAQKFLREKGTSVSELREATRAAREHFRRTGVSAQEQIREEFEIEPEITSFSEQSIIIDNGSRTRDFGTISKVKKDKQTFFDIAKDVGTNILGGPGLGFIFNEDVKEGAGKILETITGEKPIQTFRKFVLSPEVDPSKPFGFGDVTETTTVPMKGVSGVSSAVAEPVGNLFPERGFGINVEAQPERKITFIEPAFGTVTPESKTGFVTRIETIEATPKGTIRIFEREKVKEGIRLGGEVAATVAAPLVFAPGFVAGGTTTALDPTAKPLERLLGGVEAGLGAFIIGSAGLKAAGIKLTKTSRALAPAQEKAIAVERNLIKIPKQKIPRIRTFLKGRKGDDFLKVSFAQKGKTVIKDTVEGNILQGKVFEARKVGIFDKPKVIEGTFIKNIKTGISKEVIKIGELTKVTTISKTGKVTVELFDKSGKLIRKVKGIVGESDELAKLGKPKKEVVKGKATSQEEASILKLKTRKGEISKAVEEGGTQVIPIEGKLSLEPSKLVEGRVETITQKFGSRGKGRIVTKASGAIDDISVGKIKKTVEVLDNNIGFKLGRESRVKVKFGIDKSKDLRKVEVFGKKVVIKKALDPKITRVKTKLSGTRIVEFQSASGKKVEEKLLKEVLKKIKIKDIEAQKLLNQAEKSFKKAVKKANKFDKKAIKSMRKDIKILDELEKKQLIQGAEQQQLIQQEAQKLIIEPQQTVFVQRQQFTSPKITQAEQTTTLIPQLKFPSKALGISGVSLGALEVVEAKGDFLFDNKIDNRFDTDIKNEFDTRIDNRFDTDIKNEFDTRVENEFDTKIDNIFDTDIRNEFDTRIENRFDTNIDTKFDTKIDTKIDTKLNTDLVSGFDTTTETEIIQTKVPPVIIPSIILPSSSGIRKKETKKKVTKGEPGYHPEVKDKGKWIRVATKPRTEKEALALAGHVVDNSTAVQLRLIKAKKKAIKETIKKRINSGKYRDYSFRKNKRTPLPNQGLIENKAHRIDTLGEKRQLSAAKVAKGKAFKSLTRAPRAKKSKRNRNFLFGGGFKGQRIDLFK